MVQTDEVLVVALGRARPADAVGLSGEQKRSPEGPFPVVGTGVDPVTSRFSGARSTN